jgi:hypothetical protein
MPQKKELKVIVSQKKKEEKYKSGHGPQREA